MEMEPLGVDLDDASVDLASNPTPGWWTSSQSWSPTLPRRKKDEEEVVKEEATEAALGLTAMDGKEGKLPWGSPSASVSPPLPIKRKKAAESHQTKMDDFVAVRKAAAEAPAQAEENEELPVVSPAPSIPRKRNGQVARKQVPGEASIKASSARAPLVAEKKIEERPAVSSTLSVPTLAPAPSMSFSNRPRRKVQAAIKENDIASVSWEGQTSNKGAVEENNFVRQLRHALDGGTMPKLTSQPQPPSLAGAGAIPTTAPPFLGNAKSGGKEGGGNLVGLCKEDKAKVARLIQELGRGQEENADLKLRCERLKRQNSAIVAEMADAKNKLAQSLDLIRKYQDRITGLTEEKRGALEHLRRLQSAARDVSETHKRERDVVARERQALLERLQRLEQERDEFRERLHSLEEVERQEKGPPSSFPSPGRMAGTSNKTSDADGDERDDDGNASSSDGAAASNSAPPVEIALQELRAVVENLRAEVKIARLGNAAAPLPEDDCGSSTSGRVKVSGIVEAHIQDDDVNWWAQSLEMDGSDLKTENKGQHAASEPQQTTRSMSGSHSAAAAISDPMLSLLELVEQLEASPSPP